MDVVLRFIIKDSLDAWLAEAERVLELFKQQSGFQSAKACLALDNDGLGLVLLQFDSVGNYRRALSAYEIKIAATEFLSRALDEPSAYEVLLALSVADTSHFISEKSPDAETIALGEAASARAQSRNEL